jgi:hypothetical protein
MTANRKLQVATEKHGGREAREERGIRWLSNAWLLTNHIARYRSIMIASSLASSSGSVLKPSAEKRYEAPT